MGWELVVVMRLELVWSARSKIFLKYGAIWRSGLFKFHEETRMVGYVDDSL